MFVVSEYLSLTPLVMLSMTSQKIRDSCSAVLHPLLRSMTKETRLDNLAIETPWDLSYQEPMTMQHLIRLSPREALFRTALLNQNRLSAQLESLTLDAKSTSRVEVGPISQVFGGRLITRSIQPKAVRNGRDCLVNNTTRLESADIRALVKRFGFLREVAFGLLLGGWCPLNNTFDCLINNTLRERNIFTLIVDCNCLPALSYLIALPAADFRRVLELGAIVGCDGLLGSGVEMVNNSDYHQLLTINMTCLLLLALKKQRQSLVSLLTQGPQWWPLHMDMFANGTPLMASYLPCLIDLPLNSNNCWRQLLLSGEHATIRFFLTQLYTADPITLLQVAELPGMPRDLACGLRQRAGEIVFLERNISLLCSEKWESVLTVTNTVLSSYLLARLLEMATLNQRVDWIQRMLTSKLITSRTIVYSLAVLQSLQRSSFDHNLLLCYQQKKLLENYPAASLWLRNSSTALLICLLPYSQCHINRLFTYALVKHDHRIVLNMSNVRGVLYITPSDYHSLINPLLFYNLADIIFRNRSNMDKVDPLLSKLFHSHRIPIREPPILSPAVPRLAPKSSRDIPKTVLDPSRMNSSTLPKMEASNRTISIAKVSTKVSPKPTKTPARMLSSYKRPVILCGLKPQASIPPSASQSPRLRRQWLIHHRPY